MLKRLTSICIVIAIHQLAPGFDPAAMIDAHASAGPEPAMSGADFHLLARETGEQYDRVIGVTSISDPYAQRLARIVRGMKTEVGTTLNIRAYHANDINVFAMANGSIRVSRGLMDHMSDNEMRYLIAHEIGHVVLEHCESALQNTFNALAPRGAASEAPPDPRELAETTIYDGYSPTQEHAADQYALRLMVINRFDTLAAISALRKLEELRDHTGREVACHPLPGVRAGVLESLMTPAHPPTTTQLRGPNHHALPLRETECGATFIHTFGAVHIAYKGLPQ